jgi:acyl carrier protein
MDQQIRKIIADVLNVDAAVVTDDLAVGSIPEWDSVGNLAIISTIEQELGVEFPLDELFDLTSVEAIIDAVNRNKHA